MRGLLTTLFALSLAMAQDPNDPDPPSRAARLSLINGSVSFQPGGVEDWVPATPNRPLTTGDRLWTDDNSRVEMNLGSAAFRLSSRTNFTFLNLDDKTAQIQLSLGTLSIRLRHLDEDETFEVDTPQVAFTLLRAGEYRVEVNDAGDATILTVRAGDGEATANGQAFPIHARERVRISGPEGADPIVDRGPARAFDQFDLFCQDRDRREDMSQSARYVSRDMPGYADLDQNGSWSNDPQYGAVWIPTTVVVGWSPYHYGHWAWIGPWGWTWVDDAPWGYAPFHYGRWAMIGPRWGWIPGPVAVRPVYAPAMVAFVGGGGFSAAISIGGGGAAVGWFPLGPREVWVPSYHVSAAYMTRVNVSNTVVTEVNVRNVYTNVYVNKTVVNNVYVNQRVPGAVVAVRADVMTGGRPVGAAAVRVDARAMASVAVVHAAPVAPERAAVLGGRAPMAAGGHLPPPAVMNRQVVAKAAPPPAPVPFVRQQDALRANPGRPLDHGAIRTIQTSQPAPRVNIRPAAPTAPAARVAPPVSNMPSRNNAAPNRPEVVTPRPAPAPRPEERTRPAPPTPRPNPPAAAVEPVRPAPAPRPEERTRPAPPTPRPNPPAAAVEPVRPAPAPRPEERTRPAPPTPRPNPPAAAVEPVRPAPAPRPEERTRPAPPTPRPNPPAAAERRPEPEKRVEPARPAPAPRPEVRPETKPAKKTTRPEKDR